MNAILRHLSFAAGLLLACAAPSRAQTIYNFTDLGTLGGTSSYATAINNAGVIVGGSETSGNSSTQAFSYYASASYYGSMQDIGTLGNGLNSEADAVSDAGNIVGFSNTTASGTNHAFLLNATNYYMTDLGTLPGDTTSYATGINAAGEVVGNSDSGAATHAFLYSGGLMMGLGTLGGASSTAAAINAAGDIVGSAQTAAGVFDAFLYKPSPSGSGQMIDLGTLGGTGSAATGINNAGQIVGQSATAGNQTNHAFLYANGIMTDLGTLGGTQSNAFGINDEGQVVGSSQLASGTVTHAFLYSGGAMTDLNSLADNSAAGWTLTQASGINDLGWIVGSGVDPAGDTHAILLTPLLPFTWTNAAASGSWSKAANWTPAGGRPNNVGDAAIFAATSPTGTVTLDGNQTVALLQFNNGASGSGMTISAGSPAGTLTLDTGIAGSTATINVTAGLHTISAPVNLNQSVNINITTTAAGTGLTISGPISDGGQGNGIALDGGTLILSGANGYYGPTNINGGTLQAGATNTIPYTSDVTVAASGTLVLNGFSQTIDSLAGAGTVANNFSAAATLTIVGIGYGSNFPNAAPFSGVISDSTGSNTGKLSLTLNIGTAVLSGANTYTGATTLIGGFLTLDFSTLAMPTNIVSPSSSLVLAEGGYLAITDAPGAAATRQTFNGTTINASLGTSGVNYGTYGFSTVAVNANGNTNPASALVLGTLTQSAGGAVNFVLPSAGNITTITPNTNGIIGTWALVGGTDWAANSGVANAAGGFNIVAYSGYSYDYTTAAATTPTANFGWGPGNNTSTISTAASTTDAIAAGSTTNSLRFGTASNYTITLTGANTITSGGILVAGSGAATISGSGTLTTGNQAAGNNLFLNNLGGGLTVSAQIVDNGAPVSLTVTGALLSNGGNTYSGPTYIYGYLGVPSLGNGGAPSTLGASSNAAGNLVISGGTLDFSPPAGPAVATTDRLFTIGPGGATISAESGDTLIFNGNTDPNNGSGGINAIRFAAVGPVTLELRGYNSSSGQPLGSSIFAPVIGDSGTGQNVTSLEIAGFGGSDGAIWMLTGANTYTGGTMVYSGTLNTTGTGRLGPGPLDISPAGVDALVPFPAVVNLGTNQAIGSLTCGSTGILTTAPGTTLTINQTTGGAYLGALVNSGTFDKQGSGLLEFFDAQLTMNNNSALKVDGGTVEYLAYSGGGSSASSTIGSGVTASVSGGGQLELAGALSAFNCSVNVTNNSTAAGGVLIAGAYEQLGSISGTGNTEVAAGASLTVYQIIQNSLTIHGTSTAAGSVSLLPSGSGLSNGGINPTGPNNINFSSTLTSLSIDNNGAPLGSRVYYGTLDIGNNGLVIAYGSGPDPYAQIDDMIRSGYNGGTWTGTGITGSLAAAAVAIGSQTPALNIGLLDFTPGTGNFTSQTYIVFEGQTVTTNAILLRLTYMDDLVLAGNMVYSNASSDAFLFAANYGTGTTWGVGDLVHNGGPIDSSDALLFAANYVVGLPSLDGTTGNAVAMGGEVGVPEPASIMLAGIGALGFYRLARRRRVGPPRGC